MTRNLFCFFFSFFCLWSVFSYPETGQGTKTDSLEVFISRARTAIYNDFDAALQLLEHANGIAQESGEAGDLAEVKHLYAVAYYVKGDYNVSLQYYLEALELYREEENMLGEAKCLVGQGLIQQGIDRHEQAVSFFEQAIAAYERSGNPEAANPAFLNIAISEIELGEYDSAEDNLQKAIELSRQANRKDVEHLSLNKMAQINFLRGSPEKAIASYFLVLQDEAEPNGWEKSFAHAGLAESFRAQGKLEQAEEHGKQAMKFAANAQSLWDLDRNSKILSGIYEDQGDMGEAYKYLQLNQQYRDSLYDQKKLREINFMQLNSKEADNLKLQKENRAAEKELFFNRILTVLQVVLIILLLMLILLFRKNTRQKEAYNKELTLKNRKILEQNELISRQNEKLTDMNQAKDKLFSILSHDLRSPIGSIQQLLELMKSGEFTPAERQNLLDEMLVQVTGTSAMLHNLLLWASSQMLGDRVKIESLFLPQQVEKVLEAHYLVARHKNIKIAHEMAADLPEIRADDGQLAVILHNLLSNAIKYTREGKEIKISYEEKEEFLLMSILDGGEGISREKISEIMDFNTRLISTIGTGMETGTGIGLLLVKQFLQANNASMDIKSYPGRGSKFTLIFLKASPANN